MAEAYNTQPSGLLVPSGQPVPLKGHDFSDNCAGDHCAFVPAMLRPGARLHTPERLAAHVVEQTERWKVVATCDRCDPPRPMVAEEVVPHRLNHAPERLRSLARDLAVLSFEDRVELFDLFDDPVLSNDS